MNGKKFAFTISVVLIFATFSYAQEKLRLVLPRDANGEYSNLASTVRINGTTPEEQGVVRRVVFKPGEFKRKTEVDLQSDNYIIVREKSHPLKLKSTKIKINAGEFSMPFEPSVFATIANSNEDRFDRMRLALAIPIKTQSKMHLKIKIVDSDEDTGIVTFHVYPKIENGLGSGFATKPEIWRYDGQTFEMLEGAALWAYVRI